MAKTSASKKNLKVSEEVQPVETTAKTTAKTTVKKAKSKDLDVSLQAQQDMYKATIAYNKEFGV